MTESMASEILKAATSFTQVEFAVNAGLLSKEDALHAAMRDNVELLYPLITGWGWESDDVSPVMAAVKVGNPEAVRVLLEGGYAADEEGTFGAPLDALTYCFNVEIGDMLMTALKPQLKKRAYVARLADALFESVSFRDPAMVAFYTKYVANKEVFSRALESAVMIPGEDGVRITEILLTAGADPNTLDEDAYPVLVNANDAGVTRALVAAGANVNATGPSGLRSVLTMRAAADEYREGGTVRALLEAGAVVCGGQHGALAAAAEARNVNAIRALLEYGAPIDEHLRWVVLQAGYTGEPLRAMLDAGFVIPAEWREFAEGNLHARMILEKAGVA